jgi:hypothetical protein
MLRITRIEDDPATCHLRVEGRIVGAWVGVLEGELVAHGGASLRLDLSSVDFASPEAIRVLRAALERGARVLACSPLVSSLLGRAS